MAKTTDIGPFFFHFAKLRKGAPLVELTTTQEIDGDFRHSPLTTVIRLFPTRLAFISGIWITKKKNEEEALLAAIGGFDVDFMEDDEDDDMADDVYALTPQAEAKYQLRKEIARKGLDVDAEWEIISMMDLLDHGVDLEEFHASRSS